MTQPLSAAVLAGYLADARTRTLDLLRGLDAAQLTGPRIEIVNPLLWEIGHVAWFHEYFALRRLDGGAPRLPKADDLSGVTSWPGSRSFGGSRVRHRRLIDRIAASRT